MDEPQDISCSTYDLLKRTAWQDLRIKELEQKISALETAITEFTANTRCGYVAFRAQLTKDLGVVTPGQLIIYDKVEMNIGRAFHPFSSIFTAPCNGTYIFSITTGNANRPGVVHLKKNGITVEYAWAGHNSQWDMGGVATIVYLTEGDDVWVAGRGTVTGVNSSDGAGDMKHTAFAGTLLHAF